jgi:hypothetical protein
MGYFSRVRHGSDEVLCDHEDHETIADAAQCGRERADQFGVTPWTVVGSEMGADGVLAERRLDEGERAELEAILHGDG